MTQLEIKFRSCISPNTSSYRSFMNYNNFISLQRHCIIQIGISNIYTAISSTVKMSIVTSANCLITGSWHITNIIIIVVLWLPIFNVSLQILKIESLYSYNFSSFYELKLIFKASFKYLTLIFYINSKQLEHTGRRKGCVTIANIHQSWTLKVRNIST